MKTKICKGLIYNRSLKNKAKVENPPRRWRWQQRWHK